MSGMSENENDLIFHNFTDIIIWVINYFSLFLEVMPRCQSSYETEAKMHTDQKSMEIALLWKEESAAMAVDLTSLRLKMVCRPNKFYFRVDN